MSPFTLTTRLFNCSPRPSQGEREGCVRGGPLQRPAPHVISSCSVTFYWGEQHWARGCAGKLKAESEGCAGPAQVRAEWSRSCWSWYVSSVRSCPSPPLLVPLACVAVAGTPFSWARPVLTGGSAAPGTGMQGGCDDNLIPEEVC